MTFLLVSKPTALALRTKFLIFHKLTVPLFELDLQAVCLEPIRGYADPTFAIEIADMMVEYGGIMGAVLNVQEDTDALLDIVIGDRVGLHPSFQCVMGLCVCPLHRQQRLLDN